MQDESGTRNVSDLTLGKKRSQFRTMRRVAYLVEGVFVIFMLIFIWMDEGGSIGGAGAAPLHIPLPQILFVLLFGTILVTVTGTVLSALEIHAASSGEQKYIIARHSYVTGVASFAFMGFFLVMVMFFAPFFDSQIDFERRIELGYLAANGRISAPFNVTADYTGASYLNWVDVQTDDPGPFTIKVYYHDEYDQDNESNNTGRALVEAHNVTWFHFDLAGREVVTTPSQNQSTPSTTAVHEDRFKPALESLSYYIVVERRQVEISRITYHQDRVLDPGFIGSVTWMLILIMVLNAGSAVYNRSQREKWRAYGTKNY